MLFRLHIQDPASEAATVLEALVEASSGADRGGAVFAFASQRGTELLLDNAGFLGFLNRAEFELIVGVDAVTSPPALDRLAEAEARFAGLRVHAFHHKRPGALFHPKLCWFGNAHRCRALVGSGNLTGGGLLANWEAFANIELEGVEYATFVDEWSGWVRANRAHLLSVEAEDVRRRAVGNATEPRRRHEEVDVEAADERSRAELPDSQMLLYEIPGKTNPRWNQANFQIEVYKSFFQLEPGTPRQVVLIPVSPDGTAGKLEVRPSVSVRSHNFRIELGLAAGHAYPPAGRPIGVFLRVGTRRFRYRVLLPGQPDYTNVRGLLNGRTKALQNLMRWVVLDLAEFQRLLPEVVI